MNTMIIHRLSLRLSFPAGVSPGEGRSSNLMGIARNGLGEPVLRGSALAGALRHAYSKMKNCGLNEAPASDWFGLALDRLLQDSPSRIKIADTPLDTGQSEATLRTHIAVDRHRGSVREHSLFSLESLPPGTSAKLVLWIEEGSDGDANAEKAPVSGREFCEDIAALFKSGILLGGNTARGVGRAQLEGPVFYRCFRCGDLSDHADFLDERHAWLHGADLLHGQEITSTTHAVHNTLRIRLRLQIPPGQDVLVADGTGIDFAAEPQKVLNVDGKTYWKIPGSALRGPFRSWVTRLAARSGYTVSDSLARHRQHPEGISGDDAAWDFKSEKEREELVLKLSEDPAMLEDAIDCPVLRLFGSGYAKGRIHMDDIFSSDPVDKNLEQSRAHVAIDRITGGTREGALFQNRVLLPGKAFEMHVDIHEPTEEEARWINSTLMAMHHGILRIGSSKAAGFFQLAGPAEAEGPWAEMIVTTRNKESES